jgi:hypothetical protein
MQQLGAILLVISMSFLMGYCILLWLPNIQAGIKRKIFKWFLIASGPLLIVELVCLYPLAEYFLLAIGVSLLIIYLQEGVRLCPHCGSTNLFKRDFTNKIMSKYSGRQPAPIYIRCRECESLLEEDDEKLRLMYPTNGDNQWIAFFRSDWLGLLPPKYNKQTKEMVQPKTKNSVPRWLQKLISKTIAPVWFGSFITIILICGLASYKIFPRFDWQSAPLLFSERVFPLGIAAGLIFIITSWYIGCGYDKVDKQDSENDKK